MVNLKIQYLQRQTTKEIPKRTYGLFPIYPAVFLGLELDTSTPGPLLKH